MKRQVLLLIMILCGISLVHAQIGELKVDSFYVANDFSAKGNDARLVSGYTNICQDLIKLAIPLPDVKITKMLGIDTIEGKPDMGEYWIWISPGYNRPKCIRINHPEYHPIEVNLNDYLEVDSLGLGQHTYRLVVSTPSPALAEAERLFNNFQFQEAQAAYTGILNDEEAKKSDRDVAKRRLGNMSDCMEAHEAATLYFNRYKKAKNEGRKSELIDILKKAVYWYGKLYDVSGINKARVVADRFYDVLEKVKGTTVVEVKLNLMKRESDGMWVKMKSHEIKNVTVEITTDLLQGKVRTMHFDTNKQGVCTIDITDGYNVMLTFRCEDSGVKYESEAIKLAGDKHLDVIMKSK